MRIRRKRDLLVEPPSAATGDIAFNLIVFFLVCASTQPDSGLRQNIPSSEKTQEQSKEENIRVELAREAVKVNGDPLPDRMFVPKLKTLLIGKVSDEDRVVVVSSSPDVPYYRWIEFTGLIEEAGGILSLQLEEEQEVLVTP